jgi:hypothetical protein
VELAIFGGIISSLLVTLVIWNFNKTLNSYTKSETDKRIQEVVDSHSKQTERLISTMEKLSSNVETLNIKIAILETRVDKDK